MWNPDLVECMGAESAIDFKPDLQSIAVDGGIRSAIRPKVAKPPERIEMPAIPMVARGDKRILRVMKKYVTGDGRLVIREENVRNNGYLEIMRTDGRLVLNLVPLYGDEEPESENQVGNADACSGLRPPVLI